MNEECKNLLDEGQLEIENTVEQINRVTIIFPCYLSCAQLYIFLDENNNFNFDENEAL